MSTYYVDYQTGSDAYAGDSFAAGHPWRTIQGAVAATIGPGDTVKIAKSPAPVSTGTTGQWTDGSKTVTLGGALTANITACENIWTGAGDGTASLDPVSTDAKEGAFCTKVLMDAATQANVKQAYFATGDLVLNGYQKISFWFKNSSAVTTATTWVIKLCSDTAGATAVDTFVIPAIPSTGRWVPLTLARTGGGNLGALIKSIALYSGSTAPTINTYVRLDNFIACTTGGLCLQKLISKNTAEQGGTEGWFGIQSIMGTTILLDNDTNTKSDSTRGYSGATANPTLYMRDTIKTDLATSSSTVIQEVMDSGTAASTILFEGGYDTGTGNKTGETFYDGLNGYGYALHIDGKIYTSIDNLNFVRYERGFDYATNSNYNTLIGCQNLSNNTYGIYCSNNSGNTFTSVTNANNNGSYGIYISSSSNNTLTTVTNANSNENYGILMISSSGNKIGTISNLSRNQNAGVQIANITTVGNGNTIQSIVNANDNGTYGVYFASAFLNTINSLSTTGNGTAGIYNDYGINCVRNATIAETLPVTGAGNYANSRMNCEKINGVYSEIYTDGGLINSQASTLTHGSGTEWKLATRINPNRQIAYPINLSIAKIAVKSGGLTTVKAWFLKSDATLIGAKLVCKVGQVAWSDGSSDVTDTKADDTNEEELSISFTPTEDGVVEIEAWAYLDPSAVLYDVVYSLSGGDDVLGTKVAHGLTNGMVVSNSGCTQSYANKDWTVTRINDDTFTLDSASWALFTGADVTGDVVRHNNVIVDTITITQA